MSNNIENLEERRRRLAAEKEQRECEKFRAEWREIAEKTFQLNGQVWAKEAFADCFVNILREVNRVQPGPSGATELARFFELLDRGAKVRFGDLIQAALKRIQPPDEPYYGDDKEKCREQALLDVARAGLALLIENAARDQNARTRRTKRRHELIMAIRDYTEAHEAVLRKKIHGPPPARSKR